MIPILEPSNQQEAYDMTRFGFELSEAFGTPVMMRITTRLAHSRAGVTPVTDIVAENKLSLPKDKQQFILLPGIARQRYKLLLSNQEKFEAASAESPFNQYTDGSDKSLGVIACGLAYNYLMENYPNGDCPFPVLKVSQYPLPRKMIQKITSECDKVLVLEEGYPVVEEMLKGYLEKEAVIGRLDGTLSRDGELTPDMVAVALGFEVEEGMAIPDLVSARPPALCVGCSHHDVYKALNEVIAEYGEGRVFSDIGCYTLGALPPYRAINACVDMGASITMAKGAADAGLIPSVAMIGDSTFTHSGMTGLLDAINENSPITVIISDNESISMTGGQKSSAKGKLEDICAGLGVHPDHIHVFTSLPKKHEQVKDIIRKECDYQGVSVIIPRRICVQKNVRDQKIKKALKAKAAAKA